MSTPRPPQPAKLVIGVFLKDKSVFEEIAEKLTLAYGDVDILSGWFDFNYTSYYEAEMGTPLFRRMIVFKKLIHQRALPEIKLLTNAIETETKGNNGRRVNIDPGYMTPERFVLATGKNFSHRIYLDKGIYADLTLMYQKGVFISLPWTYPDYGDDSLKAFLLRVRKKYMLDLNRNHQTITNNKSDL